MYYIYILELQENKYFIGKTTNPFFRINECMDENFSEWVEKYKPYNIELLIANCHDWELEDYTEIYINKYGVDNVRGGSYISIVPYLELGKKYNNRCLTCRKKCQSSKKSCFKCNVMSGNYLVSKIIF
jgi:hypothetical protein